MTDEWRMMIRHLILILTFVCPFFARAQYKGSISFTAQEIEYHHGQIDRFVGFAATCLMDYQRVHTDFYDSNCRIEKGQRVCLSKFYGDRRYSKQRGARRPDGFPLEYLGDALMELGFHTSYLQEMESISCVGMTMTCLKRAFGETGQGPQWQRILKFMKDNGVSGTALQEALRVIGWKVYYWNPSPLDVIHQNNAEWDKEELNWKSKGHHAARYNSILKNGTYWFNKVDNHTEMVGFGRSEPEILRLIPFWVGTAHTGYHVFPGTYRDVVEAHSSRPITAFDNLEFSHFAPMAPNGAPKWTQSEKYRSGLIAIPPLRNY